jgi:hypothetical protein
MPKKGGRTSSAEVIRRNLAEARQIMNSIIEILETEIRSIGDSGKISSRLYDQLLEQVQPKTERLGEIVETLRENGAGSTRENDQLFARVVSLMTRLEELDRVGGRAKTVRKK